MKQESLSIENFQIGDIIVRMEPSAPLGSREGGIRDRSYLGKPLKFLGVVNGCIYVEKIKNDFDSGDMFSLIEMLSMITGDVGPISLPVDLWSEGWALYINPYEINGNNALEKYTKIQLEKILKEALEKEDYKKASVIQKRLDKLK